MDYLGIAAAIAFAMFWYRGAEAENVLPLAWAGPSVLISAITIFALSRGWIGVVLGQLAMFAIITAYRMFMDKHPDGR